MAALSVALLLASLRGPREWLSLFAAVGALSLALVAAFSRGRKSPLARPLAGLCFVLFGWNFAVLAGHAARAQGHESAFGALDAFFTALSPPLVFEVALVFVGASRRHRVSRWAAWAVFGGLALVGLAGLASPSLAAWSDGVAWSAVFFVGWIATLVFGIVVLLQYVKRQVDPREKARARSVLAALAIGGAFSTSDAARDLGLPLPYLGAIGTLIAAGLLTTLVVRLELLERNVSARIAVYAASMTAAFAVLYLVVLVAFAGKLGLQLFAACGVTLLVAAVARELALSLAEARARTQRLAVLGRFSAQMVHDIRGPLTALLGAVDVLEGPTDEPTRTEFLGLVTEQAKRVAAIVDRYDRMARIEPQKTIVRVDDVVRAVGRAHGIATLELGTGEADADAALLESALENVVRNAVEATGDPSLVRIRTSGDRDVRIEVVDRGPGMDARVLERAAEDFFTTKANGSGLGLAFARRVLEAHGGALALRSRPGEGTTVELRLPAR